MANAWKEVLSLAMVLVARDAPEFFHTLSTLVNHLAICPWSLSRKSLGGQAMRIRLKSRDE
jgi:hypothetical protein